MDTTKKESNQEYMRSYMRKYRQTDSGKLAIARYNAKYWLKKVEEIKKEQGLTAK